MKSVELDFIVPSPSQRLIRNWLLALGAFLLAAEIFYLLGEVLPEKNNLEREVASQSARLRPPVPASQLKPQEVQSLLKQAKLIDAELNLPWSALFDFLDSASGKDLALISLEPDPVKGQLVVMAEARNFNSMLAFYEAMQKSDLFSNVALQSHTINRNVAERPVRFRLNARWKVHA